MDAGLRRVRKLRLRSADESLNRRGAILIEDALRTASLPDGYASRLLIVRSLALGRIKANDPPSAIAMRIEARCRRIGFDAVHALSGAAASADAASSADAVYFNDDLEPCVALGLKIARGEPASEWFWPLAVPAWSASLTRDEAMRAILGHALASNAGPVAALVLLRQMIRRAAIASMLSAIRAQDGAALMRAFGWSMPHPPRDVPSAEIRAMWRRAPTFGSAFAEIARPWFIEWGADDTRSVWLACAMLAIERPALASHPELPARAAEYIEQALARELDAGFDRPARAKLQFDSAPELSPNEAGVAALPSVTQQSAETRRAPSSEMKLEPSIDGRIVAPRSERTFTMCGGLFFAVAVMERLGIARWLELHPDAREFAMPALVLRTIALDLDCSPDDPVLAALEAAPDDLLEEIRAMARNWVRWVGKYLRHKVKISTAQLVSRPARIAFTDINIDVMLRIDRADIRVRRAGLDIDPGWTPWLGRVIRFRYVGDEIYDA